MGGDSVPHRRGGCGTRRHRDAEGGEMGSGAQLESAVDDGAPAFADAACRRKAAGRMEATQHASDHVVG